MTSSDRARRAEVEAARASVSLERIQTLQLAIQLHPDQAGSYRSQTLTLRDRIASNLSTLAGLAPGATSRNLTAASATFDRALTPTGDPVADAISVNQAAQVFADELDSANRFFSREANHQNQFTRYGALVLFISRATMIGALATVLFRMQRRATALLTQKEAWFRGLVQHGVDVITVVDRGGNIRFQSQSLARVLGRDVQSVVGSPYAELIHPDDRDQFAGLVDGVLGTPDATADTELRLVHADGTTRSVEVVASNHHDNPDIGGLLLTAHDVSERNELMAELRHRASHDALTGLPTKTLLFDRLRQALARAGRRQERIGVLFLDLDGFKQVNDTLGHEAGDFTLRTAAERIVRSVRPMDTVSRIGGDEFIVLLELIDECSLEGIVNRVAAAIAEPAVWNGHTIAVTASIGAAVGGDPNDTEEELVRRADDAMYAAKRRRKEDAQALERPRGRSDSRLRNGPVGSRRGFVQVG